MSVRSVLYASVCAALLAASAAVPVVAAEKSSAAIASEKAYKALVSGQTKTAIRLYGEAIESRRLKPELLANSLLNRALAFQTVDQDQDAIDDYSAALRIDALGPKLRAIALYNRGLSYQKIKRPAMAIEDFTNALFLKVEFSQAYYSRGNVLRRSGQYLFALSDYEKSLKYSHPEPHLPLYGTALTYEALRRPREAKKALVRALTLKPDFQAARQKLSRLIKPASRRAGGSAKPTGKSTAKSAARLAAADNGAIVTGSVLNRSPDLVMRKDGLPKAVSPPARVQQAANVLPASVNLNGVSDSRTAALNAPAAQELPNAGKGSGKGMAAKTRRPALAGWAVQLSSQKHEDAAWSIWKKIQAKHKSLLRRHGADVVRADLGNRGIFYRLRVTGLDDKRQAKRLCSRLKKRGTSCFVARTSS